MPNDVAKEQRPHPATPLIRGWIVLLAILVVIGRELIPKGGDDDPGKGLLSLPLVWLLSGLGAIVVLAALGSFVSWWFTKYVIDANELRIETGMMTKRSRRVGFNRIQSVDLVQPFAARLFSLAELRIETGGGESVKIHYLPRQDAARLRDYLLARAHGDHTAEVTTASTASALTDAAHTDKVIVTINPPQLIGAFLLSGEFLLTLLFPLVALVLSVVFHVWFIAIPALLPVILGIGGLISRRVISQFNYQLADTGHGLRITRGLTNLTSQSLPVDRIQGVRIRQSALWRPFGWWRVDVDVVGYGHQDQNSNRSEASSMLLPVASAEQVRLALAGCLPGIDPDAVPLTTIPRRARWLQWWNFWTVRYGVDAAVAVHELGWLARRRDIVPHAKTQSVRVTRGPLQRRLGLASVHLDTAKGPVDWAVDHLDGTTAREFAAEQMDRARAARAALRRDASPDPAGNPVLSDPTLEPPAPCA